MGIATSHWDCDLQHPPALGYRSDRPHRVGCAVASGHNPDVLPFRCRVCVRGYRPPTTARRHLNDSKHFACELGRKDHEPPVEKYSKVNHRDDCPTSPGHTGKQNSTCVGCRMVYLGREGDLPVGRLNNHPHWGCDLAPEAHKPLPMYGIGHRPGCEVAEGHDFAVTMKGCRSCRRTAGQGNVKSARLKKVYGLDRETYDAMEARQEGACAICRQIPGPSSLTRTSRGLHVDHNHDTGKIRSLLCYNCNIGLGNFRDDPALLIAASEYLRGHADAMTPEVSN